MAEYIDQDALLQGIEQVRRTSKNSFPRQHFVVGDVLTCIRTAPAADVAPVRHGYWEFPIFANSDDELDPRVKCSECGEIEAAFARWNYCPNCGALMMEAEHDG